MSKKYRKHGVSHSQRFLVDVVITTGGRWDFLRDCLEAVRKQTVPSNIILIDNASELDEKNQNATLFENVSTKRFTQNLGFPAANNEGARMGSAPFILFLNDDCVLREDTIQQMLTTMNDNSIGVVGAKLLYPKSSTSPIRPAGRIQHVGLGLNIRGDVIHPLNGWTADHPKACVSRDVFAVTGACLMIRRNLFSRIGGFDVSYGAGTYEDVELCLKARTLGARVFLNSLAIADHYAGATVEKKNAGFPVQFNSMLFKGRWAGTPYMAWDEFTYWCNVGWT